MDNENTAPLAPSPGDKGEVEMWVAPRPPKLKLEKLELNSPDYRLVSSLFYDFMKMGQQGQGEHGIFYFSNNLGIRAIVSEEGQESPKALMTLRLNPHGGYLLGINFPLFRRLSLSAQKQLLKQQILRIPYGHLGSRAKNLINQYGQSLVEMAGRVVLSQVIDPGILAEQGVIMPVPEMWDLPRNLSMEEYCSLLFKQSDKVDGIPRPIKMKIRKGEDETADPGSTLTDEVLEEMLKQLADGAGFTRIDDMDETAMTDAQELDFVARETCSRVDNNLRNVNSSLKQQGFMAGDALEFIESLFREPKVNWGSVLRNFHGCHMAKTTRLSKRKISPRNPNRRDPNTQRFLVEKHGRTHTTHGIVLMIIDTSGSMGARELSCVESEIRAIAAKQTVYTLQVDYGVACEPRPFSKFDKLNEFFGRGGTSFRPGFERALQMHPLPNMILYFTDGYGDAPEEDPGIPTLWLLTSSGMKEDEFKSRVCTWGDVVVVDVDSDT